MTELKHITINGNSDNHNIDSFNLDVLGEFKFSSDNWRGSNGDLLNDPIYTGTKKNKIDFNKVETIYRTPKLSLPREKLNVINNKYNTKTIRDINKADCIITSGLYIQSLIDTTWSNLVIGTELLEMLYKYKGKHGFNTVQLENEFIANITDGHYYTFQTPSTYYWDVKGTDTQNFVNRIENLGNSRGYHSYITPHNKLMHDTLYNNRDIVILDKYVNSIATEDSLTIDTKVYNQLKAMFSSSDKENIVLGMEIIANCNVEESKGFIALLFFNHSQSFRDAKSWNHVNFKTIRSKFEVYELTYARHSISPYDGFIKKLIEDKGLTKFVMESMLDTVYEKVIESSFGMNANAVFELNRTDLKLKPEYEKKCIDKNLGEVIEKELSNYLPF
jgi:hypothetical protein|tara:strand:+ start:970 stop:2136 length:1167 start_codon:yes stop_codon:yes gene_type:complete